MFQGQKIRAILKMWMIHLPWIIDGNLWSILLELFQGTKDEFPISHSQGLGPKE